jgi:ADP-ribose diphosphatase
MMTKKSELADLPADVTVLPPEQLAKGYRDYWRHHAAIVGADGKPVEQQRDVVHAGKVVGVLPVDLARAEVVLIRQFRMAAHLANGHGDLVEIVAGRVEDGEPLADAARRECTEEIGVAPAKLVEVFRFLSTPGVTDEELIVYVGAIDASQVKEGAVVTVDGEQLYLIRVPIDTALAALGSGAIHNGLLLITLQWLALNRTRLAALLL